MPYFIKTIFIAIVMLSAGQMSGQKYVVDPFMRDSVTLNQIQIISGKEAVGIDAVSIAAGDTVSVLRRVDGFPDYGVIKVDGKEYAISVFGNLCFIDDEEVEDPWETLTAKWRTPDGRLYSTLTPYQYIVGLVLGSLLLLLIGLKWKLIRLIALIFVPLMIALACYLEVRGYLALGTRMFWWCDSDVYGFWGSVLRVLPFSFVILAQLASFPLYGRLVSRNCTPMGELTPMAISFLIVIPVMFIVCLVLGLLRVSNSTLQIIAGIIIIAIIGLGSMSTIVLNIKSYGFFKGMGLTIFGVVYIVGAMIAVLGFAIALWNLFVQMLVAMLPWLLCTFFLFAAGHAEDPSSGRHELSYEQQKAKNEREAREHKERADTFERGRRINEEFMKGGIWDGFRRKR